MAEDWNPIEEAEGIDGKQPILVWHIFQGVLVTYMNRAKRNRFVTHWRAIDDGAWIPTINRKPCREDADVYSCVISLNKEGEISMAGWRRFEKEADLIRWQTPPEAPETAIRKYIEREESN